MKNTRGYTLIEILVGLVIISVLFTVGFVGFRDFSRRQALSGVVKEIQGSLRLAQGYALAGQKPDSIFCSAPNSLVGYNFNVVSETEYKIEAVCSGGTVLEKSYNLSGGILIVSTSPNPILFKVLGTGTNIPSGTDAAITIAQNGTNSQSVIYIGSGGEIK